MTHNVLISIEVVASPPREHRRQEVRLCLRLLRGTQWASYVPVVEQLLAMNVEIQAVCLCKSRDVMICE